MVKLLIIPLLFAVFFFAAASAKYTAPYKASKFRRVLSLSKLQEYSSKGRNSVSQDKIKSYSSYYFQLLSTSDMQFKIAGSSNRCELREMTSKKMKAAWSISTKHEMSGRLSVPKQESGIKEVTFMQVHCGPKPLLRLAWVSNVSKKDLKCTDCIVAHVRKGLGRKDIKKYFMLRRHSSYQNYYVKVSGIKLTIAIAGKTVINKLDVSFWKSYKCYFKAGAYNNNPTKKSAEAEINFSQLTW